MFAQQNPVFRLQIGDSVEVDQHSVLIAITIPGSI